MLEKLGYRVLPARGGQAALEVLGRANNDIQLVILDLIMPEMDGGKTFDRLRAIRPDLRVVLSSGYALDSQAEEIMRRGCNGLIQKPFNISELSNKLRAILDRPEPR
jgi:CheY-like chemotaxis protein